MLSGIPPQAAAPNKEAQHHPEEHQQTQDVKGKVPPYPAHRCLQGADGTGPQRAGAGVAVENGDADPLCAAGEDFPLLKAQRISIQQNGGFIQGIRPGKPTADYLKKINNRITLFGAIYLSLVAFIPSILSMVLAGLNIENLSLLSVFSTTGILIVVSVALELDKQLESQLMMKNYKGFLK